MMGSCEVLGTMVREYIGTKQQAVDHIHVVKPDRCESPEGMLGLQWDLRR